MSKERLESLKRNREWTEATGGKFYTVDSDDYKWIIEQAELVGYFARKNGELNEFLNKYIESKHLGKNVIDVAMDIIVKQAERVQELEQQNKRYKQALKFYADEETYETKFATDTDEIFDPFTLIELDNGEKARKALEGEE